MLGKVIQLACDESSTGLKFLADNVYGEPWQGSGEFNVANQTNGLDTLRLTRPVLSANQKMRGQRG
jgi:hypothetical protein